MGDFNTIFEAGQSLVELFKKNMTPQPIGSEEAIGLCAPHDPEDYALTIWIYSVELDNESGGSIGFRRDPQNSEIERYAPLSLRFRALVSAHSKAPAQKRLTDEYRILGRAMQIVHDTPVIPADYLVGSLAGMGDPIKIEYQNLTTDELSKVWNNTGKPLKPSFGLLISSVNIESNLTRPIQPRVASAKIRLEQKNR